MKRQSSKGKGMQTDERCPKCGGSVCCYQFVRCERCGTILKDLFRKSEEPRRLKITLDKESGEIWIRGNKAGLEYLASGCLKIIGKTDPSGHILLQWQMNNLLEGSTETRLEFTDDEEDFRD